MIHRILGLLVAVVSCWLVLFSFELQENAPVPQGLLAEAMGYFNSHRASFPNQRYVTVVDFSIPSNRPRMFIVNPENGSSLAIRVAHGAGSDPGNTGMATQFSDSNGSHMSSLGFFRVSETFHGTHGVEIALDGLSSTNAHARSRAILIHSARYVVDANRRPGMSWGCFAVSQANHERVVSALSGGSLLYAGRSR